MARKTNGMGEGYGTLSTKEQAMEDDAVIRVKQGNRIRLIDRKDVIYIKSIGRKAVLHLEQETVEYYAKISRLEEQLRPAFFRVHRAYLVNLDYIESYTRREVRLKNAESVLISKYRIREFQKILAIKLEKG